ncbi:ABC transporter ATP-binding protein [Treponema parvum]|uniref:ABC transporter ATP-binding protein n=1 Tax=Treponema parvum TaxID=138851 RepID=UPI001AEBABFC|nr:ABC transporter ATP-binding protein [Treponema parvum]QTQ15420.1 ABC transporter ATP-binding protein [Treponema parvum]
MVQKKSALGWILDFASSKKRLYICSVFLAIIGVMLSVIPYVILGGIVVKLLEGGTDWSFYLKRCGFMALCWVLRGLFHSFSTSCSHIATFNVLARTRALCLDKIARMPLGDVLDKSSGSIKNTICERIDQMETTLAHVTPEFTANILGSIAVFVLIFNINWKLGLSSLVTIPLGFLFYSFMTIDYKPKFERTVKSTKALNDTAVEYINGIEVIKAFGKADSSYEKFALAAKEGSACFVDWQKSVNVWFSLAMSIFPATLVSVLPLGAILIINGTLEPYQLIYGIILSICSVQPLLTVATYTDDLAQISVIVGEVADILQSEELSRPAVLESDDKKSLESKDLGITLEDVHFAYKEKEVLHGINMEIPSGKVTAFVGPSGSGKSTVAKLIASLWDVKKGSIKIGGIDVKKIPLEEVNKLVAYVNQDNFLFDRTVRENIRIGKPGASDKEVEDIAKRAGCYDFIMSLENGFETMCGTSGGHLSGGEKQRICIARAMLKDAPIVILDEATAYTDPESEAVIQASVASLVKGKTLIVIAHRLSTICESDRIYVINDGNIENFGTHAELLNKSALYKTMWQSHIGVKDE